MGQSATRGAASGSARPRVDALDAPPRVSAAALVNVKGLSNAHFSEMQKKNRPFGRFITTVFLRSFSGVLWGYFPQNKRKSEEKREKPRFCGARDGT